jgi:polar amino acid transport system substrate-binding protein
MADAPLVQYAIVQNPDWGVHQVAFCEPELADYPQITAPGNIVLAGSKANPELIAEISKKIRGLWERCEIKPIAAKYGLTDDVWFTPGKDRRVGVDRPAGWTPPVCKK